MLTARDVICVTSKPRQAVIVRYDQIHIWLKTLCLWERSGMEYKCRPELVATAT